MYRPKIAAEAQSQITEKEIKTYPSTPVTVSAGDGFYVWGPWTEIVPSATITSDFIIIGVHIGRLQHNEGFWSLEIGYGDAGAEETAIRLPGQMVQSNGSAVNRDFQTVVPVEPFRKFAAGTRIAARLGTNGLYPYSVNVRIQYVELPL